MATPVPRGEFLTALPPHDEQWVHSAPYGWACVADYHKLCGPVRHFIDRNFGGKVELSGIGLCDFHYREYVCEVPDGDA